ncbi:uncharacterized protein [Watersipora subatra]|uniref:uncharacterized protein n=1 Tax=Watersipora subatra TaxID=2589382 RepID=UPI00355C2477
MSFGSSPSTLQVVPLKHIIPQLVLQSTVEAVKLSTILKSELNIDTAKGYFWSDSAITLGYIENSEARHPMFADNRIEKICNNSNIDQWNDVPGISNPADILSRGTDIIELLQSAWRSEPSFLSNSDITMYLKNKSDYTNIPKDGPAIKRPKNALETTTTGINSMSQILQKFSSWSELVKAIDNAKKMLNIRNWKRPELSPADLLQVKHIVKLSQLDC